MLNYESSQSALRDVLILCAMSYKTAIANLELGGAWSVIIGDALRDKSPNLFRAYGRAVDSFRGNFFATVDVGTTAGDLRYARETTEFVTGWGDPTVTDPSPYTAESVFRSAALAVKKKFNRSLDGITVLIEGVGKVGSALARKYANAGSKLIITDKSDEAAQSIALETGAKIIAPNEIFHQSIDVFCPCALGRTVDRKLVESTGVGVIAGGANDQVADIDVAKYLLRREVLYAPDYLANAGGIIQIAAEINSHSEADLDVATWRNSKIDSLMGTLGVVFDRSQKEGRPTAEIADAIAASRIYEPTSDFQSE